MSTRVDALPPSTPNPSAPTPLFLSHYRCLPPSTPEPGALRAPGTLLCAMLPVMQSRSKKAPSGSTAEVSTRVDTLRTGGLDGDISPEVYERARLAFLEVGTLEAVRQATGLSTKAVLRLVDSGVPQRGLPSLRDAARIHAADVEKKLRLREKASAEAQAGELATTLEQRAKAAKAARQNEAKVLGDAVASRADEVLLVRANRKSALALARVNADLLQAGHAIAGSILEDTPALKKLSARERLGLLRTIAGIVHRTAQSSQVSVNMERLLMGEPTAILGRTDGGPRPEDMTLDEAEQWLSIANRAFERRARRSMVIDVTPDMTDDEAVNELTEDL